MKIKYLAVLGIAFVLGACSSKSEKTSEEVEGVHLEGSWKIVAQIDKDAGKTEWEDFGGGLIYQKHLTPTHFTWLSYNPETDELEGAGGGSYTLKGNVYTENIEFFHPLGEGLVGQSIVFDARLEDGVWLHKGSSPMVEFNPETGDMEVYDTTNIEEKWVKISDETNTPEMVKTWHLVSFKETEESTYDSYPDFVGYMKLLTPSHFVWVRYNNADNGGEVTGLGSGKYTFDGDDTYVENIQIMHPPGSRMVGTVVDFDFRAEEGKWFHYGYTMRMENGVAVDSSFVDEIWVSE